MNTAFLELGGSLLVATTILCGCGPSAKQLAEQEAIQKSRQNFREAVAAVKVCTQGSTYQEFHEKKFTLETTYTANQSILAGESKEIEHLISIMEATDILWTLGNQIKIQFTHFHPDESKKPEWAHAMLIIKNGENDGTTWEQMKAEHDFPDNYVRRGLTLISKQCDELLARDFSLAAH